MEGWGAWCCPRECGRESQWDGCIRTLEAYDAVGASNPISDTARLRPPNQLCIAQDLDSSDTSSYHTSDAFARSGRGRAPNHPVNLASIALLTTERRFLPLNIEF